MSNFTNLELGALNSIFAETPEFSSDLVQQFERASVTERENSGSGFFTTISVLSCSPRVNSSSVLGHRTIASIEGLAHGMGFVLFMDEGYLNMLEGYTFEESTTPLNLEEVGYTICSPPID